VGDGAASAARPWNHFPDGQAIESLLRSHSLPIGGAMYLVGMALWLLWAWFAVSLVVQIGLSLRNGRPVVLPGSIQPDGWQIV
jgi:hypothetical protein